jgi:ATPase subunit of ABC transporter with duplicated ATPase domains
LQYRESLLFASKIKNRVTVGHLYRDNFAQTGESLLCLDSSNEIGLDLNYHYSDDFDAVDNNGNFDHNLNVRKILCELLLEDCADNSVQTCSGGEQKRLSVGLELVQQMKPNLLCIDEPTSGLDSNASELVFKTIKQINIYTIIQ